MGKQIKCKKASFWLDDGILFCKIISDEFKKEFSEDFLEEYVNAITELSAGGYYPLLIDLRILKEKEAFAIIKIIANNPELKSAILSKSFVVNSYFIQLILIVFRSIHDPIIPNKVFRNFDKAISYSKETHQIFNAVY